jgi:cell division FtsZ-interacting protein ZapD
MSDKIELAKSHLATCMEREDWPSHNCACDCGDVSELLAEVERLKQEYAVQAIDQGVEVERLRAENTSLREALSFVKTWAAVGTLDDEKMATIQQTLEDTGWA